MPHALPTEALIKRSLSAWQASGLTVGGIEVSPDGTVRILAPVEALRIASEEDAEKNNTCDEAFG